MRILVTGNAGSGKTTLARKLGNELNLPVIALDKIVWKPGWIKAPQDEVARKVTPLLAGERWVIDGVSSLAYRAADTIVFLDYPRRTCLRRALFRSLLHLFHQREDVPENCPEHAIVWRLIKLILWQYPKKTRPIIVANLEKTAKGKKVIWIRSAHELNEFLDEMKTVPARRSLGSL